MDTRVGLRGMQDIFQHPAPNRGAVSASEKGNEEMEEVMEEVMRTEVRILRTCKAAYAVYFMVHPDYISITITRRRRIKNTSQSTASAADSGTVSAARSLRVGRGTIGGNRGNGRQLTDNQEKDKEEDEEKKEQEEEEVANLELDVTVRTSPLRAITVSTQAASMETDVSAQSEISKLLTESFVESGVLASAPAGTHASVIVGTESEPELGFHFTSAVIAAPSLDADLPPPAYITAPITLNDGVAVNHATDNNTNDTDNSNSNSGSSPLVVYAGATGGVLGFIVLLMGVVVAQARKKRSMASFTAEEITEGTVELGGRPVTSASSSAANGNGRSNGRRSSSVTVISSGTNPGALDLNPVAISSPQQYQHQHQQQQQQQQHTTANATHDSASDAL